MSHDKVQLGDSPATPSSAAHAEPEVISFKAVSDPEANGRTPQSGDSRYTVFFPLEDGRRLEVFMGREGVANLRRVVMDQFMDEQFEMNGPSSEVIAPIPMILYCPNCVAQHVDAPEPVRGWTNPPHKSHLCHCCGTIWRPADVPTTGVREIKTRGEADNWKAPVRCATCGDTGEVVYETGSPVDIEPTQIPEPCPDCRGGA